MKKILITVLVATLSLGFASASFASTHHQQDNSLNNVYFGH